MDRSGQIIRTSVIGIIVNVLLAAFKAFVGILASSVAIVLDAVNNLSDALSSVITIAGTKLSLKPADNTHPFGYGRVEYFSAIIISAIVLTTGITSMVESIRKIINPVEPDYTTVTLIVIIVAIISKLILGLYVRGKGRQLQSDALTASGSDALFDAVITLATLVSAGIMLIWNVSLDGYLGALISVVIIKAGIEMLASPINQLLGANAPADLIHQIKKDISAQLRPQPVHRLTPCGSTRHHDGRQYSQPHAPHIGTHDSEIQYRDDRGCVLGGNRRKQAGRVAENRHSDAVTSGACDAGSRFLL